MTAICTPGHSCSHFQKYPLMLQRIDDAKTTTDIQHLIGKQRDRLQRITRAMAYEDNLLEHWKTKPIRESDRLSAINTITCRQRHFIKMYWNCQDYIKKLEMVVPK